MKDFKVSVLIPCFNGEKYVSKCIESILRQTYKNIELILLDDGSSDSTFKIFKKYAKKDRRISIYKNETNLKIAQTRNILISKVTGKYFTFVDSDDFLHRKAVERWTNKVWEKDGTDIVVGKSSVVWRFFIKKRKIIKMPFFPSSFLLKKMSGCDYVKSNICLAWGSLIRTDFYRSLKISFERDRYFEEVGVMSYVYMKAKTFAVVKRTCYYYFKHPYSVSSMPTINFSKINDIVFQTKINLERLERDNLMKKSKSVERAINGWIYMCFSLLFWVELRVKHSTKEEKNNSKMFFKKIKYELLHICEIDHNIKLKFSSTWWKFIMYFLIISKWNKEIKLIRDMKKNISISK